MTQTEDAYFFSSCAIIKETAVHGSTLHLCTCLARKPATSFSVSSTCEQHTPTVHARFFWLMLVSVLVTDVLAISDSTCCTVYDERQ